MAAVQIGTNTLVFGTTDTAYGFFENLEYTETAEVVEATDADGDITDVEYHGKKTQVTGTYLFLSTSASTPDAVVGTGTAITIANANDSDSPSGNIYISEAKIGYTKNDFKKVDFTGTIYPSLS